MIREQLALDAAILSQAHLLSFQSSHVFNWLAHVFGAALAQMAPLLLLVVAMAVLASLVQTGPVFTFFPLKPQLDRLNPVAGFKRLFSMRMLFELSKNLVKLALIAWLLYLLFWQLLPALLALLNIDPKTYVRQGFDLGV